MRRLKQGVREIKHVLVENKIFKHPLIKRFCSKRFMPLRIFLVVVACSVVAFSYQQKNLDIIYANYPLPKPQEIVSYPDAKLSFGLINDIHALAKNYGGGYVLSPRYKLTVEEFTETMRDDFKPDFMVANGDVIDGTYQEPNEGMAILGMLKTIFEKAGMPAYWVIGNHDLRSLSDEQWLSALEIDYLDKAFFVGDYKIILMDSQYSSGGRIEGDDEKSSDGILFSDKQKKWLEKELQNTRKIPVVFMHNPPFEYIDNKPCGASAQEAAYLQDMFARYHVAAVFAGHIEKLFHQKIGGVDYYVLPGIKKNGVYFGTFSEITMTRRHAEVDLFYRDAANNEKIERVE